MSISSFFKNVLWHFKDSTLGRYRRCKERIKIKRLVGRGLRLGKNVTIMPGVELEAHYCYLLSIGDNTAISTGVRLICHDATTFNFLGFSKIGRIDIGKNCLIGERVVILPNVTIGDNSLIAIGSIVNKNIPPNSRVAGNPARIYGKFDELLEEQKKEFEKRPKFDHFTLLKAKFNKSDQEKIRDTLSEGYGYSTTKKPITRYRIS